MGRGGQEDSENEEEVAPDERIDWLLSAAVLADVVMAG